MGFIGYLKGSMLLLQVPLDLIKHSNINQEVVMKQLQIMIQQDELWPRIRVLSVNISKCLTWVWIDGADGVSPYEKYCMILNKYHSNNIIDYMKTRYYTHLIAGKNITRYYNVVTNVLAYILGKTRRSFRNITLSG